MQYNLFAKVQKTLALACDQKGKPEGETALRATISLLVAGKLDFVVIDRRSSVTEQLLNIYQQNEAVFEINEQLRCQVYQLTVEKKALEAKIKKQRKPTSSSTTSSSSSCIKELHALVDESQQQKHPRGYARMIYGEKYTYRQCETLKILASLGQATAKEISLARDNKPDTNENMADELNNLCKRSRPAVEKVKIGKTRVAFRVTQLGRDTAQQL